MKKVEREEPLEESITDLGLLSTSYVIEISSAPHLPKVILETECTNDHTQS
jgi:hypothetical protein